MAHPGGPNAQFSDARASWGPYPACHHDRDATAEIYTLVLARLLVAGVLWVVTRFTDRH